MSNSYDLREHFLAEQEAAMARGAYDMQRDGAFLTWLCQSNDSQLAEEIPLSLPHERQLATSHCYDICTAALEGAAAAHGIQSRKAYTFGNLYMPTALRQTHHWLAFICDGDTPAGVVEKIREGMVAGVHGNQHLAAISDSGRYMQAATRMLGPSHEKAYRRLGVLPHFVVPPNNVLPGALWVPESWEDAQAQTV